MALAFMPSGGTRWVGSHADCPSDPLADGDRVSGTGSVTSPDGPDGSDWTDGRTGTDRRDRRLRPHRPHGRYRRHRSDWSERDFARDVGYRGCPGR